MRAKESRGNTGDLLGWDAKVPTGTPQGESRVEAGVGEVRSSEEASNDRGAKGPWLQGNQSSGERAESDESLTPPDKLWELQEKLHAKAKENPERRFHALYDKLYRSDVLAEAWRRSRANAGASGVDGEGFEQIEARGVKSWLWELAQELQEKRYKPDAVRRVMIPKPGGKKRPLGIPTIKDRVVQMAAVLILEPIFEADLQGEQYGYRACRNALEAVGKVQEGLDRGMREVVDADLRGYFDTIPHPELMKCLARRISDGSMLALLKAWLQMPVEESDGRGGKRRSNPARREKRGTPQGAPISPLLSNLYMRRYILGWKKGGYEKKLKTQIVNYADDFVILCANTGKEAYEVMERMMGKLKLEVNREKTRICRVPQESFDFLGYTIGQRYSPKTGRGYIGTTPSRKKIAEMKSKIHEMTHRRTCHEEVADKVKQINALLVGWSNYFCLGTVTQAYKGIDAHVWNRLRRWLQRKHQGRGNYSSTYFYDQLGLVRLTNRKRNLPWAKA